MCLFPVCWRRADRQKAAYQRVTELLRLSNREHHLVTNGPTQADLDEHISSTLEFIREFDRNSFYPIEVWNFLGCFNRQHIDSMLRIFSLSGDSRKIFSIFQFQIAAKKGHTRPLIRTKEVLRRRY